MIDKTYRSKTLFNCLLVYILIREKATTLAMRNVDRKNASFQSFEHHRRALQYLYRWKS